MFTNRNYLNVSKNNLFTQKITASEDIPKYALISMKLERVCMPV